MLLSCGSCGEGQLGLGSVEEEQVFIPRPVLSLRPIDQLESTGEEDEDSHQLMDHSGRSEPQRKGLLIRSVACGSRHSVFLTLDGSLFSCGNNDHGQLGHEGQRTKPRPIVIPGLSTMIVQVSAGASHTAALTDDGRLFTWGNNLYGQLGTAPLVKMEEYNPLPVEVNLAGVTSIICGSNHNIALTKDGSLYSWGLNTHGQLGLGHAENESRPQVIRSLVGVPFRRLAAGSDHSFALSVSGALFGWGRNTHGQLGSSDTTDRLYPIHLKQLRYQKLVYITCGGQHSAALTYDGRLFTFGCGLYGQLGHGSKNNEELPRQVMELMGSKVTWVTCGRSHTVVIVGQKILAFGIGGSGQLGLGTPDMRLVPTLILRDGLDSAGMSSGMKVTGAYGGGDQTFIRLQPGDSSREPSPDVFASTEIQSDCVDHLTLERLKNLCSSKSDDDALVRTLQNVFSNLSCINCSFLQRGLDHFGACKSNHGLRMDDIREAFDLIESTRNPAVYSAISDSIQYTLFPSLTTSPPDVEALRIYLILPWCHLFTPPDQFRELHSPFASAMTSLSKVPKILLEHWWSSFEIRHFNRVLKIFKQVVAHIVDEQSRSEAKSNIEMQARENALKACLQVLAMLKEVNQKNHKVPFDLFYIPQVTEKVDVRAEYARFVMRRDDSKFSFCDYPFIFEAAAKTLLLQTDAAIQMQLMVEETNRQNFQSLFVPLQPQVCPYLILSISRENIVDDTVSQLLSMRTIDLKKPLKVQFHGEEADDAGGVKKEFFLLLFQELLHPKYGMYKEYEESRRIWFATQTFEEVGMYRLVGMLCGLAIYNSVIVNLPFPLALYKKLLNQEATFDDLAELSPTEARSLEDILSYDGDDMEDVFCLTFQISISSFGAVHNIDLKPNGSEINVTKENREEYVDLYVKFVLNESIRTQFDAFADGFHRVVTSRILHFFQPQELMEMVIGNEHYDWDEFEKNTEYKGEYWRNHETIKLFWEVFHDLNLEQKKKFMVFLTGSDRVPLLGMKQLKMTVQPTAGGDDYHPAAHTCFNLLDLPKYKTRAKLRSKLLHSIEHTQGFTLV